MNKQLFNYKNADKFRNYLVKYLTFPFVSCSISTLGGRQDISLLLTVSKDKKENWVNNILENSQYNKIHVLNNGEVKGISGSFKIRKFKAKGFKNLVQKLNSI